MKYSRPFLIWAYLHIWKWRARLREKDLRAEIKQIMLGVETSQPDSEDAERAAVTVLGLIIAFAISGKVIHISKGASAPRFGEHLLYLFLSKRDQEYLVGDLAEEYLEIQSKLGRRAANVWYYQQVASSIWPLSKKAIRWRLLARFGDWFRRLI